MLGHWGEQSHLVKGILGEEGGRAAQKEARWLQDSAGTQGLNNFLCAGMEKYKIIN